MHNLQYNERALSLSCWRSNTHTHTRRDQRNATRCLFLFWSPSALLLFSFPSFSLSQRFCWTCDVNLWVCVRREKIFQSREESELHRAGLKSAVCSTKTIFFSSSFASRDFFLCDFVKTPTAFIELVCRSIASSWLCSYKNHSLSPWNLWMTSSISLAWKDDSSTGGLRALSSVVEKNMKNVLEALRLCWSITQLYESLSRKCLLCFLYLSIKTRSSDWEILLRRWESRTDGSLVSGRTFLRIGWYFNFAGFSCIFCINF